MKGVVLESIGGPEALRYADNLPDPVPGPDEVVVRLRAAALNRRDLYARLGQYPGVRLPAIPGSDGSGEVAAVGGEVNPDWLGREVVINPALNWGPHTGFYGPDFSILGVPQNGTFAQFVAVKAAQVFPKPPHLDWEEAAAYPLAGLTAYRALATRGQVRSGEKVLVPGIGGGVATVLLQFARSMGARVYVASSRQEKVDRAVALGAEGGVVYEGEHWVDHLQAMMGLADCTVDTLGGELFSQWIRLSAPGGRIVVIGATRGPVPNLVMPRLFFKQLDIRGTTMGSPDDFAAMIQWIGQHRLHPVIDRVLPLKAVVEAQGLMESGEQFGKIVLQIP